MDNTRDIKRIIKVIPSAVKYAMSEEARGRLSLLRDKLGDMYEDVEICIQAMLDDGEEASRIVMEIIYDIFPEDLELPTSRGFNADTLKENIHKSIEQQLTIIPYS